MMYKISMAGIELIKSFEGFSKVPYICSGGKVTIGYGHVILMGEKYDNIDKEQATKLLMKDIVAAEYVIACNITAILKQHQFDALVSIIYNIGAQAFITSSLRAEINRLSNENMIAAEFMRWIYSKGKIIRGLVLRRQKEAEIFKFGY